MLASTIQFPRLLIGVVGARDTSIILDFLWK